MGRKEIDPHGHCTPLDLIRSFGRPPRSIRRRNRSGTEPPPIPVLFLFRRTSLEEPSSWCCTTEYISSHSFSTTKGTWFRNTGEDCGLHVNRPDAKSVLKPTPAVHEDEDEYQEPQREDSTPKPDIKRSTHRKAEHHYFYSCLACSPDRIIETFSSKWSAALKGMGVVAGRSQARALRSVSRSCDDGGATG